jgi:lipase chaperone LimK
MDMPEQSLERQGHRQVKVMVVDLVGAPALNRLQELRQV